jgi:hypothetical protein
MRSTDRCRARDDKTSGLRLCDASRGDRLHEPAPSDVLLHIDLLARRDAFDDGKL